VSYICLSIYEHLQKRNPNYLLKEELEAGYLVVYTFDEARQPLLHTKVRSSRTHSSVRQSTPTDLL